MSMKNPSLQDGAAEGLTAAETPFQRFVANYFESRVATVAFFVLVVILTGLGLMEQEGIYLAQSFTVSGPVSAWGS